MLIAHDSGPQVAVTERPITGVVSLEGGEEVEISVPILDLEGELTVSATVINIEGGEVEVGLYLGNEGDHRTLIGEGKARLVVSASGNTGSRLRLSTFSKSGTAAVRWQNVCLYFGDQRIDVPLSAGSGDVDACPPRILPALRQPIEKALIEWDWRMQDGIGTQRAAVTYAEAIDRTLLHGQALIQDLQSAGVKLEDKPVRWQALGQKAERLKTAGAADEGDWEDLWRQAHRLRREIILSNPLAHTGPLAFIKQVPGVFSHQLTQYYGSCARPGGGLFVLDSPGESMACRQLGAGLLPLGSYQHLDVSCDGDRVRFAYCEVATTPKNREEHLDRYFHLYEIATNGVGLRQLTSGPYDDFAPRYLPNGKMIFISTRRGGFHRCGRGPCPVYTLALAEADGSNPHPISYHETHEWDPDVLPDGRIIYTRWDYVDRHAVYYEQLWTARPEGSDVRAFYGNNTFNPVGVWEARAVPGSLRIMATAAAHHAMTAGSIILLDTAQGQDGLGPITRLTPEALFPESEAPVRQIPRGNWEAPAGIERRGPVPPEALRWPGHCYRTPCPLSEKYFIAAYSFDTLIGEPTWNRANMFGLYLVDAFGNKELLYRDLNIASLWPAPLRPRPRPAEMPELADDRSMEGTFFLQNVYHSWPKLPRESIKRLRIVQVLPKSTPHINAPTLGLPNASPGKQVLGTVPVEADGSAYFRAPAGIPLSFQALDERGQAVQIMRSLTYLQPGEQAVCAGCHEPRDQAPPQRNAALALRRPPSVIKPGPAGSNPFSYPLLVQPVLNEKCVGCHQSGEAEGAMALTGEPQGRYTVSYNALAPKVPYSDWGGRNGDFRQFNHEPLSSPDYFGARGSQLMHRLLAGHHEVTLEMEEVERLATWMDLNALFYGTFEVKDQASQQRGHKIAGSKIQ